jgi:catechol 2,3-dioxygenase-like lactoylglutathione lyase family enzyme
MPEWPKGAACKVAGDAYGGSNPPPPTDRPTDRPTDLRVDVRLCTLEDMTIQRMDNVGIVFDDLKAAVAFFLELGLELEGETTVEGRWAARTIGLDDVKCDIAMLRTPDGHSRLELSKFHAPPVIRRTPEPAPVNALGYLRVMFAVDDIEDVLARLQAHGAELVGELERYQDSYRLCYVPGPEGIIVALAEQLS